MAQLENFRLKVFRAVAEHLNFHKAAEHLFLTQPAVTLQIKALEDDLGVRLFDRAAGRISLTRLGAILLRYAGKIAVLTAEAEQELGCNSERFRDSYRWESPLPSDSTFSRVCLEPFLQSIRLSSFHCIAATRARLCSFCSTAKSLLASLKVRREIGAYVTNRSWKTSWS